MAVICLAQLALVMSVICIGTKAYANKESILELVWFTWRFILLSIKVTGVLV
jgi:hypothetical protein